MLPRLIYLSHQFSFFALGEDYHGLIRRYQFDVPCPKIEVRKEIEISAYSTGAGESFIQSSDMAYDISSSFDEPLHSAMSSPLDYTASYPSVIPMFPNGAPGAKPHSFRNSIPIQKMAAGLSDGMSEGLGRLRREIGRVRSPKLSARGSSTDSRAGAVLLEFDEADEDFLLTRDSSRMSAEHDDDTTSRGEESLSTPSSDTNALAHAGDPGAWAEWEVEDTEQFHEISVVGYLDEEQAQMKGGGG